MKRSREPGEDIDCGSDHSGEVERYASEDPNLPSYKLAVIDSDIDDEDEASDRTTMRCSLPPHREPIDFRSYQEYESHYTMFHTNRCLECHKNFPSEHLLGVHIEECHDPLVRVRRDKGEHTFSCFVEGCERKCLTHQKRRLHMIDKHMYPKNFFFGVTKDGIDGRRSLLVEGTHQRRESSTASASKESQRRASIANRNQKDESLSTSSSRSKTEQTKSRQQDDADMADLTGAMSALQFVPASIRFGRGRAGFSKS